MIDISLLPYEIQYLILGFVRLENSYNFDIDSVYSYVEPYIFMTRGRLCVNISGWFGTKNPEEYRVGNILHTINVRPYSLHLERSFGIFSKILYRNIKKFKLRNDIIDKAHGKILFAGTFGPLKKGLETDLNLPFNKLSSVHFHYDTNDILGYIKETGIEDPQLSYDSNINKIIQLLNDKLIDEIKESIIKYSKITKNYLGEIKLKKIRIGRSNYYYNKLFFSICKNKSNNQKLIELDLLKKIKNIN